MANTKITTNVIADDAVTSDKLGGDLTMPGHVSLADSKEIRVGTGNDLVIKHDGSHTTLTNTTGNLILAGGTVYIANAANNEYMAQFVADGAASLKFNNVEELATVSGGVYIPNELGIGTNSPAYPFTIELDQSEDWLSRIYNTGTTETDNGVLIRTGSEHAGTYTLAAYSGSSYKFVIRGDGKVGIGTASPTRAISISGTGSQYMNIVSANDSGAGLLLGDTDAEIRGAIIYDNGADTLQLRSGGNTTRMTIDGSGDVSIGGSLSAATLTANNGVLNLDDNGSHNGVINSPASLYINVDTDGNSSGEVLEVGKDRTATSGGTVLLKVIENGNVEVTDGNLFFASGHGIDFGFTGNSTGNLGTELLNDYEDGTWTPQLIAGTTNPTGGGYAALNGRYTKIGNRVWVTFYVGRSWTNTPAGAIYVSGLPYTINASTNNWYSAEVVAYNVDGSDSLFILPNVNSTTLQLYASSNNSSWAAVNWSTHTNGTIIYVSASYHYHV